MKNYFVGYNASIGSSRMGSHSELPAFIADTDTYHDVINRDLLHLYYKIPVLTEGAIVRMAEKFQGINTDDEEFRYRGVEVEVKEINLAEGRLVLDHKGIKLSSFFINDIAPET